MLTIKNLEASVGNSQILKGVDLVVGPGEMHVLMGPNGSGKSTLAQVIAGAPQFTVQSASRRTKFKFESHDLTKLTPDKRAKLGIFLGFQHPVEVPGVSVFNFLRRAKSSVIANPSTSLRVNSVKQSQRRHSELDSEFKKRSRNEFGMTKKNDKISLSQFRQELLEYASSLKLSDDFLRRSLNEGFSGGEKKRNEILQMMALRPKLVILDEIDSGLDVDGLRIVADAIKRFTTNNPRSAIILITHYARILKYLKPDFVHVMVDGKIVKSGTFRLAAEVEKSGYEKFQSEVKSSFSKENGTKFKMQNYGSSRIRSNNI